MSEPTNMASLTMQDEANHLTSPLLEKTTSHFERRRGTIFRRGLAALAITLLGCTGVVFFAYSPKNKDKDFGELASIPQLFANPEEKQLQAYKSQELGGGINGYSEGRFGESVSISAARIGATHEIRVAVGEPLGGKSYRGVVKVYRYNDEKWKELGDAIEGPYDHTSTGFAVSLSANGKIVATGEPNLSEKKGLGGCTRVFKLKDNKWENVGMKLGEESGDNFGWSVALSCNGKFLAVGQPDFTSEDNNESGMVKVYQYDGGWKLEETINGIADSDEFGAKVSLSGKGNILAIGVLGQSKVQVYQRSNSGSWSKMGSDIQIGSPASKFGFGLSVSVDGGFLAIGSLSGGTVAVYKSISNRWVKYGNSISKGSGFGHSVSVSKKGEWLVVGDTEYNNVGRTWIYQYDKDSEKWVEELYTDGQDDGEKYGYAVSAVKNAFVVGSPLKAVYNTPENGQVKVYEVNQK